MEVSIIDHSVEAVVRPLSRDTDPQSERVQLELLRAASPARKFELSQSMTSDVLRLQRSALRALHPEVDEQEIAFLAVTLNYGEDLAARVRAHVTK